MTISTLPHILCKSALAISLTITLAACGGGSGNSAESSTPSSTSNSSLVAASSSSASLTSSSAPDLSSSFSSSSLKSSASSSSSIVNSSSSIASSLSSSSSLASSEALNPKLTLLGGAMQGASLNLKGSVNTLAGSASADGIGSAARFNKPMSVASDGTHLYVADMHNRSIRKIVIATGAVSTLAGGDNFSYPSLCTD